MLKKTLLKILESVFWILAITSVINFALSYRNYLHMYNYLKSLENQILENQIAITYLDKELAKLRTLEGIERAIREKIMMTKPGEIIIKTEP